MPSVQVLQNPLPPSPFKEIYIITDGRCASACSQFVTKMQLGNQSKVATFGGFHGLPIDSSSAAGGKVEVSGGTVIASHYLLTASLFSFFCFFTVFSSAITPC